MNRARRSGEPGESGGGPAAAAEAVTYTTRTEKRFPSGTPVAIALGSNLEPRLERLRGARRALEALLADALFSPIYETEPRYVTAQPRFLNACCVGRTRLAPGRLLDELAAVERAAGREAGGRRFGPRELDLDILLYGDEVVDTDRLTVPHPRLAERPFVLVPLRDVAPGWRHPRLDRLVSDLQAEVGSEGVERTHLDWTG